MFPFPNLIHTYRFIPGKLKKSLDRMYYIIIIMEVLWVYTHYFLYYSTSTCGGKYVYLLFSVVLLYLSAYTFSHHTVEKMALCVNDEIEQTPYRIIQNPKGSLSYQLQLLVHFNLQRMDNLSNKYLVPKCQLLGCRLSPVYAISLLHLSL